MKTIYTVLCVLGTLFFSLEGVNSADRFIVHHQAVGTAANQSPVVLSMHAFPGDKIKITCTHSAVNTAIAPATCFDVSGNGALAYFANSALETAAVVGAGYKDDAGMKTWTSEGVATLAGGGADSVTEVLTIPTTVNHMGYIGCKCTYAGATDKMAWFIIHPSCDSDSMKKGCGGKNESCYEIGCGTLQCNALSSSTSSSTTSTAAP